MRDSHSDGLTRRKRAAARAGGRRRRIRFTSPDLANMLAFLLAVTAGGVAWFTGLGLWWSIGILVGVFVVGVGMTTARYTGKIVAEMSRLVEAGEFASARRLGDRAAQYCRGNDAFKAIHAESIRLEDGGEPMPPELPLPRARMSAAVHAPEQSNLPGPPELPELPPGPASPVISPLSVAVIALYVAALVPALGIMAGPALFLLSFLLYKRPQRAPWDLRVAKIGLLVSTLSLFAGASGIAALILRGILPFDLPDMADGMPELPIRVRIIHIVVIVLSIVLHEIGHAAAARISGDPTAEQRGRLSLNPFRHLSLFGSVILPVVLSLIPGGIVFGWAKPVPIDPDRFQHRRRGEAFVSIAGVATNVMLALACSALIFLIVFGASMLRPGFSLPELADPLTMIPAEGLWGGIVTATILEFLRAGIFLNLFLACLNLVPIPPLDGSRLLMSILPERAAGAYAKLGMLGLPLILILVINGAIIYAALPGLLLAVALLLLPRILLGI